MNKEVKHQNSIAKYLSGNSSPAEEEALFAWMEASEDHQKFFEEAVQVWQMTEQYEDVPIEIDTAAAWQKLDKTLFETKETPVVQLFPWKQLMRIAAVFLVGIFGFYAWYLSNATAVVENQQVVWQTGEAERNFQQLPDGSTVWLNENTQLSFDKNFENRLVHLTGEAFFKIKKQNGQSFEVQTDDAKTVVLGTEFNVRAYPEEEEVEVTVREGKVAFAKKEQSEQAVVLTAGKTGVFDKKEQKVSKKEQAVSNADAWQSQRLEFKDTPLAMVLPVLERYFDTKISVDNPAILKCPFNGQFQKPQLEAVLQNMEFVLRLKVEETANGKLITGKGCQ